jgi:hypothetical protein
LRAGVAASAPRRGAWRSPPWPGPAPASGARRGARAWPASTSGAPGVAPTASPRGRRAPDAAPGGRSRSPVAIANETSCPLAITTLAPAPPTAAHAGAARAWPEFGPRRVSLSVSRCAPHWIGMYPPRHGLPRRLGRGLAGGG